MIELPRACFIADQIARHADFFSFGTNDLTQCGIGFSRDDIEGRIIPRYVEEKIVDGSPFAMIDQAGVGELVRIAVRSGCRSLGWRPRRPRSPLRGSREVRWLWLPDRRGCSAPSAGRHRFTTARRLRSRR
jgi:hypothetical protein